MDRRQQILLWLKEVLDKNLSGAHFDAFIFGSQANLISLRRSDIDLGVMSDGKISAHQLSSIEADIECLPMLYNVDLVDFNSVDTGFKEQALQNIERL